MVRRNEEGLDLISKIKNIFMSGAKAAAIPAAVTLTAGTAHADTDKDFYDGLPEPTTEQEDFDDSSDSSASGRDTLHGGAVPANIDDFRLTDGSEDSLGGRIQLSLTSGFAERGTNSQFGGLSALMKADKVSLSLYGTMEYLTQDREAASKLRIFGGTIGGNAAYVLDMGDDNALIFELGGDYNTFNLKDRQNLGPGYVDFSRLNIRALWDNKEWLLRVSGKASLFDGEYTLHGDHKDYDGMDFGLDIEKKLGPVYVRLDGDFGRERYHDGARGGRDITSKNYGAGAMVAMEDLVFKGLNAMLALRYTENKIEAGDFSETEGTFKGSAGLGYRFDLGKGRALNVNLVGSWAERGEMSGQIQVDLWGVKEDLFDNPIYKKD